MSGIPRDYPVGMNGFPQVIRGRAAALHEEFLVRLISRDPHGRESLLQHVMAVGDERAPDPQQPAAEIARLSDGTPIETIREDADDLERNGWPGAAKRLRSLLASYDSLLESARDLAEAACRDENTIGRMRSGITEAIALLEDGSDYDRMHVAGTLRAAL